MLQSPAAQVWFISWHPLVSGAQNPQTKGISEFQSVGKVLETRGQGAPCSANQEQLSSKEQLLFPFPGRAQHALGLPKSRDTLPLSPAKGRQPEMSGQRHSCCLLRQMWPDGHVWLSPVGEGTSISEKSRMSSSWDSTASAWLLQDACYRSILCL